MMRQGFLFILLGLFLPVLGFAQNNEGGAKAGLIMGYTVPDADNAKPHRAWGVLGSAMLNKTLSVDGYYVVADKQIGTGARMFDFSMHGVGLTYNVPAGKGTTFYGVRAGLSKLETEESGNSLVYSPYHWGVAAGFDYNLFSFMTIGFQGDFLLFDDSETTEGGNTFTEDQFRTITFSVTTKLKF